LRPSFVLGPLCGTTDQGLRTDHGPRTDRAPRTKDQGRDAGRAAYRRSSTFLAIRRGRVRLDRRVDGRAAARLPAGRRRTRDAAWRVRRVRGRAGAAAPPGNAVAAVARRVALVH